MKQNKKNKKLGCVYTSCLQNKTTSEKLDLVEEFGLCLPTGLEEKIYETYCGFNKSLIFNSEYTLKYNKKDVNLVVTTDKCKNLKDALVADNQSSLFWTVFLVSGLLLFVAVVIFYRYKVKKKKKLFTKFE